MRTLRNHLVGLPLQKSVFTSLGNLGALFDVPGLEADAVLLSDDGRLLVADGSMSRAAAALCDRGPRRIRRVAEQVRMATTQLEAAAQCSVNGKPVAQLLAVGEALQSFIPIPILGKAVTDALLAKLETQGLRGVLPRPQPSPGLRLTADVVALGEACRTSGWPPQEVAASWPAVPEPIRRLVESFAEDHVGFGPMPWDARGWEDASYVASQLVTVASAVRRLPDVPMPATPELGTTHLATLYNGLAAWLDATERGLFLVRRAFYLGIRPHLLDSANVLRVSPTDLLFVTFSELATALPSGDELMGRRQVYNSNRPYLDMHGIDATTLEALVPKS